MKAGGEAWLCARHLPQSLVHTQMDQNSPGGLFANTCFSFLSFFKSPSPLVFGVMVLFRHGGWPQHLKSYLVFPILLSQPPECWVTGTLPPYPPKVRSSLVSDTVAWVTEQRIYIARPPWKIPICGGEAGAHGSSQGGGRLSQKDVSLLATHGPSSATFQPGEVCQ